MNTLKRFLVLLAMGLLSHTLTNASDAVFHIQALDASGEVIRSGTGFFSDRKGKGITHSSVFRGARQARIITSDSVVYAVNKVFSYHEGTGLVLFGIDVGRAAFSTPGLGTIDGNSSLNGILAPGPQQEEEVAFRVLQLDTLTGLGAFAQVKTGTDAAFVPLISNNQLQGVAINGVSSAKQQWVALPGTMVQNMPQQETRTFGAWVARFSNQAGYLNGLVAYANNNFAQVERNLSAYIQSHPEDAPATLVVAQALQEQNKLAQAQSYYTQVIKSDNKNAAAYQQRGVIFYRQKNYEPALADLDKAIKNRAYNAEVFYYRGHTRYEMKDYAGALSDLNKAEEEGASDALLFYHRGNTLFLAKKYPEAIDNYDRAISLGQKDEVIYNNRGKAKYEIENYEGAVADFTQAISISESYAKAWYNRANAHYAQKNWAEATQNYSKAVMYRVDLPADELAELYFRKGYAWFVENDYEKSLEALNRAATK